MTNVLNGSYPFSGFNINYDILKRLQAVSLPELSHIISRSSLFSFLHINSHNACNKIDNISNLPTNLYKFPNLIFAYEIWFKPCDANYNVDQNHAYYFLRTCKSVGGISIYVHDSLVSLMISCDFKPVTFEYIACLLQVKPRTICVCVY